MGIYLQTNSKGVLLTNNRKAADLIADGAVRQDHPHYVHDKSVCVVENGVFDAAAFAFDEREFDAFLNDGTRRVKHWLEITPEQRAKIDEGTIAAYRNEPVIRGRPK